MIARFIERKAIHISLLFSSKVKAVEVRPIISAEHGYGGSSLSLALGRAVFLTTALIIQLTVTPLAALANEAAGGAHGGGGIPTDLYWSVANFLLFVGLLVFFLRGKIVSLFASRLQTYNEAIQRAQIAKQEAEKKRQVIADRLAKMESGSTETLKTAKLEAEELKARLVGEANTQATRLESDAQQTIRIELESAKLKLRQGLLDQSVGLSSKLLSEKIAEADQRRLQTEFVKKIEVVQP
jgi:F0F1-type ATP synthase membrane subunit b/b'